MRLREIEEQMRKESAALAEDDDSEIGEDLTFWIPHCSNGLLALVEEEVYIALKEFLTSDDPNLLCEYLIYPGKYDDLPEEKPSCVALRLYIDGREREAISRDFPLADLVDFEIEGWECGDGIYRLGEGDARAMRSLASFFEEQSAKITTFLATATILSAEEEKAIDDRATAWLAAHPLPPLTESEGD